MRIKLSKIRGHTILRKMLSYEELICDKIIQNILNPKKSEGDKYDESRNEYSGVSHAEGQTMHSLCALSILRFKRKQM